MAAAVGIDLGTTNTVIATVSEREGSAATAAAIADAHERRLLPSVVSFHPNGQVLVGEMARERRVIDPENTIFSVKRLLGRGWTSPEVQDARQRMPFKLMPGERGSTMVEARGVAYALPEISAFILRRAKAVAENALQEPVDRAVVTVPANFNELQRGATKMAAGLAGLRVLRILNEPTAAALAYGQALKGAKRVAVYDLGGGTFDVTVLDLTTQIFEVLATAGDSALGGDDIDTTMADLMRRASLQQLRFDPYSDPVSYGRLRLIAEEWKRELSVRDQVGGSIDNIAIGPGGVPLSYSMQVTRNELEAAARPLIDRTLTVIEKGLGSAHLKPRDIDEVLLVGGASRMPMVARAVKEFFGRDPVASLDADEVVALGAAIAAKSLAPTRDDGRKVPALRRVREAAPPVVAAVATQQLAEVDSGWEEPIDPAPLTPSIPDMQEVMRIAENSVVQELPQQDAALRSGNTLRMEARPPLPPRQGPGADTQPPPPTVRFAPAFAMPSAAFGPESRRTTPEPLPAGWAPGAGAGAQPPPFPVAHPPQPAVHPTPPPLPAARPAAMPPRALTPAPQTYRVPLHGGVELRPHLPLLIDVTPLDLRVETAGGFTDTLLLANTPVPCDKTRIFSTASDRQTHVVVRVAQGEWRSFADNVYLGEVELTDLEPRRRGETKISVTFELDADGRLNVQARDEVSGRAAKTTLRLQGVSADEGNLASMQARQASAIVRG